MEWSSNSPDLNPIENMWQIVKNNVEKRMPKDIGDLWQKNGIKSRDVAQTLIKLVLQKNGDRISY